MKKSLIRPLVITAAVIVLLAGVYFLIELLPEWTGEAKPSSPSSKIETTRIIECAEGVTAQSISITSQAHTPYTITTGKRENGNIYYELTPMHEGFRYTPNPMLTLLSSMTNIVASRLISENPSAGDLGAFGFTTPLAVVKTKYSDGSSIELLIGSLTPIQDAYYVKRADRDAVYTLSTETGDRFLLPESAYRDLTMMPEYSMDYEEYWEGSETLSENIQFLIKYILLERSDMTIELRRRTAAEKSHFGIQAADFTMLRPMEIESNAQMVNTLLLQTIIAITGIEVVEDDPADLSKYGLGEPVRLEVADLMDNKYCLLIGGTGEDGFIRYVMKEGVNTVVACYNASFSFLDVNFRDIVSNLAWIHMIGDVEKVVYVLDGERRELVFSHGETRDDFSATLDDRPIIPNNARRLYTRSLGIMIADELPADAVYGEAQYTITLHMLDGSRHTMELCPINARQYAMVIDGVCIFYTESRTIKSLLEGFELNAAGKEIPSVS